MDVTGGAYGAGKAGAPFDPILFAKRHQVIVKAVCLLFGIIVFGCISSGGWYYSNVDKKEICLYNKKASPCHYGESIALLATFSAIGFLVGEYLFGQFSSVKTRKHYVLLDLGLSAFWAFMFFVGFCYLANQWSNMELDEEMDNNASTSQVSAAIVFSFFSVFSWAGSTWFAYQRYLQGNNAMFASNFEEGQMGGAAAYSSYSQDDQPYQDPPFSNQDEGGGEYPAPTY
ncbi:synaptogyrin [Cimex lectularius]|uniref:Synaptogyrin n=1 Tax=Cimex lectularius TaxID=79782 RepID=A0A8I6TGV2_CIMLE|nr:synaptogyrin [Cimex lectularius]